MAEGRNKRNNKKKAQLSLFDENVLAEMEPVKSSSETDLPANAAPATTPPLPAEIPIANEPAQEQKVPPEQPDEKEAMLKAKHKKDQEARLAALWKARGKK